MKSSRQSLKKCFAGLVAIVVAGTSMFAMFTVLQPPRLLLTPVQTSSLVAFTPKNLTTSSIQTVQALRTTSASGSSTGQSLNSTAVAKTTRNIPLAERKVLCVDFIGRLGNQMFQYAAVFGLARKLQRVPVYGSSSLLNSAFRNHVPSPQGISDPRGRCNRAKYQEEGLCCSFHQHFTQLDPNSDYKIGKYLQSWKYFEGLEEEVRKMFQFSDNARKTAAETIENLRRVCNKTLIGVHVRRGDYLKAVHVNMGYRIAPPSYFQTALEFMRKRFSNVTFLVSTDDEKWFRDSVTSASDVRMLKRQDAVTDMAVLSSLDHVITSVGTYSWWVGFLNRGLVVYWKDFIAPGTTIGKGFNSDGKTFIYPGWIPL